MSRMVFDTNTPLGLSGLLPGHEVTTTFELGWDALSNGALLAAAEEAGFDIMVTADQSIRYQQNLVERTVALVVLETNHWPTIRAGVEAVQKAVGEAREGSYRSIAFARPPLRRRPFLPD